MGAALYLGELCLDENTHTEVKEWGNSELIKTCQFCMYHILAKDVAADKIQPRKNERGHGPPI